MPNCFCPCVVLGVRERGFRFKLCNARWVFFKFKKRAVKIIIPCIVVVNGFWCLNSTI